MNRICKQLGYLATGLILLGASSCFSSDAANSVENQSTTPARTRPFRHLQLTGNQIDDRSTQAPQPSNSVASVLGSSVGSETILRTVFWAATETRILPLRFHLLRKLEPAFYRW